MAGLSAEQLASYRERGFVRVPALLGAADVAALGAECDRLVAEDVPLPGAAAETYAKRDGAGRAVRSRYDPVLAHSPLLQKLLANDTLRACLRSVFGEEASLFKDKLILKPPGARGYDLHQDFAYYGWTGVRADQLVALQLAVDDADADNGAVQFCIGRHAEFLEDVARRDRDARARVVREVPSELVATRAGDAVLFHSLTPHWSDANRSQRSRRSLYLTYNAASAGDLYRIYYQERGAALP